MENVISKWILRVKYKMCDSDNAKYNLSAALESTDTIFMGHNTRIRKNV